MNCSICGAQIPDGQPNCPNCGAMVQQAQPVQPMGGYQQPVQPMQPMQPMGGYQQPVQPMGQQPMGGYQQPMGQQPMGGYQQPMGQQPMGGYQQPMGQAQMGGGINPNAIVGALKGDLMKLVGLVGAFLIFLTPFFTWLKMEMWGEKESGNFFDIADLDDCGIFTLLGILLLIVGLAIMFWDLADYAPAFANIKAKVAMIPYFDIILCGVALLIVIIALAHGDLNDYIELVEDWGGEASRGFGPVIGFIGVIAAAAPRVLNILGIKIGK
ncbi:MAG: hypothetical protein J6A59_06150 [Lachnospiraceae bacterium]|nr:hypothetical protein [Lachnospiraceae bacterium]